MVPPVVAVVTVGAVGVGRGGEERVALTLHPRRREERAQVCDQRGRVEVSAELWLLDGPYAADVGTPGGDVRVPPAIAALAISQTPAQDAAWLLE